MVQVYIYNPAKMAKEKSTMMRLPHWIVRRTLACLRWCSNIQFLSKLISLLFREKKKLQDELNQLSRNCLKDVQSRSTLNKYNFNSRSTFLLQVFNVCTRQLLLWSGTITVPSKSKEALNL